MKCTCLHFRFHIIIDNTVRKFLQVREHVDVAAASTPSIVTVPVSHMPSIVC